MHRLRMVAGLAWQGSIGEYMDSYPEVGLLTLYFLDALYGKLVIQILWEYRNRLLAVQEFR
jgi:hypothetical protein